METLNLSYRKKSTVDYIENYYPDGQVDIVVQNTNLSGVKVEITSRFNDFNDLGKIIAATKALRGQGVEHIELYIPYLLGARSDRKFVDGGCSYLRDVVAPIINAQGYKKVKVLDPHSDVAEAVINNLVKKSPHLLLSAVLEDLFKEDERPWDAVKDSLVLVSPDAGAAKKVYELAKKFDIPRVITATKHRDVKTGTITDTHFPGSNADARRHFIVVDDICDGGRTFKELADEMNFVRGMSSTVQSKDLGKNYLVVSHGIFSKGLEPLKGYEKIYTTNSIKDFPEGQDGVQLKQINVL